MKRPKPPATPEPDRRTQPIASSWRALVAPWLARILAVLSLMALLSWALPRADLPAWTPASAPFSSPVPTAASEPRRGIRIPCVSYAPFRREGHSPFDPTLRLTRAELHEDLTQLATITDCVRLYGVGHGLDQVPAIAREVGLRVVLGAWIDRDEAASRRELDTALHLARQFPDVVRMLVVGNEVLLRQERRPEDLAALLQATRQRSPVPVAYADVWEFWLRHAAVLAPAVDVAAIHLLPYWEDDPVGLPHAVDHVMAVHEQVRARLHPLPVWVAETGWPSLGRQRGPTQPGVREQAAFVRGLLTHAPAAGLDYNLIEGFDQPWKRALEGAMGGAWGLFDARGQVRDPHGPTGRLPSDPAARWTLFGAAAGLLLGGGLCLALPRFMAAASRLTARADRADTVLRIVLATLCGSLLGHHLSSAAAWVRSTQEALMAVACVAAVVWMAAAGLVWAGQAAEGEGRIARGGRGAVLLVMAASLLALAFDGRYRPLPWSLWAVPAFIAALAVTARPPQHPPRPVGSGEAVLARLILLASVGIVMSEGWANHQALGVAAAAAVLAGVSLWEARQDQRHRAASVARAAAKAAITTAQADQSAS